MREPPSAACVTGVSPRGRRGAAVPAPEILSSTCCQWPTLWPRQAHFQVCGLTRPSVVSRLARCCGGGGQQAFRGHDTRPRAVIRRGEDLDGPDTTNEQQTLTEIFSPADTSLGQLPTRTGEPQPLFQVPRAPASVLCKSWPMASTTPPGVGATPTASRTSAVNGGGGLDGCGGVGSGGGGRLLCSRRFHA